MSEALLVYQDHLEHQEHKVSKANEDRKDLQEHRVQLEKEGRMEGLVREVLQANKENVDSLVNQGG